MKNTFKEYLNEALWHSKDSERAYEELNGYGGKETDKPKDINNLKSSDYILTIADDKDDFVGMIAFDTEKEAWQALDRKGEILDSFDYLSGHHTDDYTFDVDKVGDWHKSYPSSVRMPTFGFDYRD